MKIKYLGMFADTGGSGTGLQHAGAFFMPVGCVQSVNNLIKEITKLKEENKCQTM